MAVMRHVIFLPSATRAAPAFAILTAHKASLLCPLPLSCPPLVGVFACFPWHHLFTCRLTSPPPPTHYQYRYV